MAVIYRPEHQRQINNFDPYGGKNCAAYSAAMAADRATLGGVKVTGKQVRAATNEPIPDPNSPGLNLGQLQEALADWHIELTPHSDGWPNVLNALRKGRGVVLCGDYDQLGSLSCQANFLGDHGMFINNLNAEEDKALCYDPLCHAYRWVPTATLKKYAEKFGSKLGGGTRYASTRITPNIAVQIN